MLDNKSSFMRDYESQEVLRKILFKKTFQISLTVLNRRAKLLI